MPNCGSIVCLCCELRCYEISNSNALPFEGHASRPRFIRIIFLKANAFESRFIFLHISIATILPSGAWPQILFLIIQTISVAMVCMRHVVRQNKAVHENNEISGFRFRWNPNRSSGVPSFLFVLATIRSPLELIHALKVFVINQGELALR